jgi:pyruvate,water dikinase
VPFALLRYALLEVGARLAARAQIAARDDVFFLEHPEARAALVDGGELRALVQRRKGERAWVLAHPGPPSFGGDPGPPPSFGALPPEARLAHEALMWVLDRMGTPEEEIARRQTEGPGLTGIAASGGQFTGPVRVIMGESQFDKLRPGDVLVCPITSPVWSVLFPSIAALVTDSGGILSRPTIIAREYRIPAVVATGNATTLLRDGQIVTVDGTAGLLHPAELPAGLGVA